MLLLAIDTSGRDGSIALATCEPQGVCEILEVVPLTGGTFSAQLIPQIAVLLGKHRFTQSDIGAFIVASGPGSFTGLRVGLAAIKALAEALGKPIAAVSLLEATAAAANEEGTVLAALDAGRGQIYVGEYEGKSPAGLGESLVGQHEFLDTVAGRLIVTPDSSIAEVARAAGLKVLHIEKLQSDVIARVGWRKIQAGETISPEDLDANYIRRSDAEIFAKSGS